MPRSTREHGAATKITPIAPSSLYRSEGFAEDLPGWQEAAVASGYRAAAGTGPLPRSSLPRFSAALLCALPMVAAVLGAAAAALGLRGVDASGPCRSWLQT